MKKIVIFSFLGFLLLLSCEEKKSVLVKPESNRFSKQTIKLGLCEPIALTISNAGDVFYCLRRGEIYVYEPKKGSIKQLGNLLVDFSGGNGIMGMTLDPNFDYNKKVYVFYIDTAFNYKVSRFKIENDSILQTKEETIFSFKIDHEPGAHNGGTILFDKSGNLLISTGDNTPPWQANGFPPHDQNKGREIYDALRTAANSNDFRGKILRIKPLENGNYIIPDGNLFAKNGSQGKPEIYIMGCRNPWKMSIDDKTGFVYWGEVGPDAGLDSTIGPRGYDEINQARKAGNFGWPMFVADNKPYSFVPLLDSLEIKKFNKNLPYNPSKNNTGTKLLPIPEKAFIYYPYSLSKEFPLVGKAARTACAGPVYDYIKVKNSNVKFPKYYHEKLFIYEWMRGWIMAVSMDKNGNYVGMEKVLENLKFVNPTHIAFAPDGSLYVLEYGLIWYTQNKEASLSRIIFSEGNRPPVPLISCSDTIVKINQKIFINSVDSYDFDNDSLQYEWWIDNNKAFSKSKQTNLVFSTSGIYLLHLKCTDSKQISATTSKKIIVGNSFPCVKIKVLGNNSTFYFENGELNYSIDVTDNEDKKIDTSRLFSNITYMPQGSDIYPMIAPANGHIGAPKEREITENKLIAASDCKSCHAMNIKSVGPSFNEISKKYSKDANAISILSNKIIKGGGGVWGPHAMSAHPQISIENANSMVKYILSLQNQSSIVKEDKYSKIIPKNGKILTSEFTNKTGWFYLTSTYTDDGINGNYTLSKSDILTLKNSKLLCYLADSLNKCMLIEEKNNTKYVGAFCEASNLYFKDIDMHNITSFSVKTNSKSANGMLQLRENSPNGIILGSAKINAQGEWAKWEISEANILPTNKKIDVYITFDDNKAFEFPSGENMLNIDYIKFNIMPLPSKIIK